MTQQAPSERVLNSRLGWSSSVDTDSPENLKHPIVADAGHLGLRLPSAGPGSAISFNSTDGSLGGLLLPRGFAMDQTARLIIANQQDDQWRILRFDPVAGGFENVARLDGGANEGAVSIAVIGDILCLPDVSGRRVILFDLSNGVQLDSLTLGDRGSVPIDIAAHDDHLYLLSDSIDVYRWSPLERQSPELIIRNDTGDTWTRIAVDVEGYVHVLIGENGGKAARRPRLGRIAPRGLAAGRWSPVSLAPRLIRSFSKGTVADDANTIRHLFPTPPVRLWTRLGYGPETGIFFLDEALAHLCDRRIETIAATPPEDPLRTYRAALAAAARSGSSPNDRLFRRDGTSAAPPLTTDRMTDAYHQQATWYSIPIDSRLTDCQWDSISLEFTKFPVGSRVEVSTFTSDEPVSPEVIGISTDGKAVTEDDVGDSSAQLWATNQVVVNDDDDLEPVGKNGAKRIKFLIQSRPGRYLYLRIKLVADGHDTPAIREARIRFPREGYLDFLPAVFSADNESRWFLERFLAVFQSTWDDLTVKYNSFERLFDLRSVPDGEALRFVAACLGQSVEYAVDETGRRRILFAAPKLNGRRTTAAAFQEFLNVCLANLTDSAADAFPELPCVVEGFRERRLAMMTNRLAGGIDGGATLWGEQTTRRLTVGTFSKVGDARLLPPGNVSEDLLSMFANTFRVYVPDCWLSSDDKRQLFKQAIEAEKPAHTSFDLCAVKPALRVELQSTIGVDTIVGQYPVAEAAEADGETPAVPMPNLDRGPIISISPPPTGSVGQPILP